MENPISAGDLAVVVRAGFHGATHCGTIFVVQRIHHFAPECAVCRRHHPAELQALWRTESESPNGRGQWFRVARLKRIPPLSELEGVLAQGEIKHPITGKVPA